MKINLVQLKRKKRKNGEIPIYLRFTENRKSRYKSTGISVLPKDWNGDAEPTPQVRKSHPRYKTLNNELERLLNEARDAKIQLSQKDNLSLSTVKQELSVKSKKNLLEFAEYYENKLDNENRYWEHRHFKVLRGNLKDFLASKTLISLDLNDLNSNIIDSFQNYLLNDAGPKKKGNSNNTVNKKIQRLKGMVTQATDEGLIEHDPFFKHDPLKKEPTQKAKL
ncbi:MAG TPA: hypothetical protein DD671_10595, partial [Balneolaceae bacterium]|nr:hypothetical protein [Balneolaceae bacterium]